LRQKRRRSVALLLAACCIAPGMAAAQDQCRTIRALTNMDGRRFADLSIRVGGDPFRLDIAAGRSAPLPAPKDCSFALDADDVDISCIWRPEGYEANVQLFDSLLARFRQCLGEVLTPPSGPQPYGDARALRDSTTTLPTAGGETRLSLFLIESPATPQLASYHYVTMSVAYEAVAPDED
jgi:hypothetical protein